MTEQKNPTKEEIEQEDRKLRYLRLLVHFSLNVIAQTELTLEEALDIVENVKQQACRLFPGKEEAFEIIYRPRFNRLIKQKFSLH